MGPLPKKLSVEVDGFMKSEAGKEIPLFAVLVGERKYSVYVDGHTEGFGEDAIVFNNFESYARAQAEARQVFTPQEVKNLNEYQQARAYHPFTCGSGNRTDADHLDGEGILFATVNGWICPWCDYTQGWAHDAMKDGEMLKTWKAMRLAMGKRDGG